MLKASAPGTDFVECSRKLALETHLRWKIRRTQLGKYVAR